MSKRPTPVNGRSDAGNAPPRLDAAARQLLVRPIDAATRAELDSFLGALDRAGAGAIDPPTLSGRILQFLMPRLSNPDVLRLERRTQLLEHMLRDWEAMEGGGAQHGVLTLRQELRGLSWLRANRDGLIGG